MQRLLQRSSRHKVNPVITGVIILFILIAFPFFLGAQEDNDPDFEPDWVEPNIYAYSSGDQTFVISLGLTFPTIFTGNDGRIGDMKFRPKLGGTGILNYNYYIHPYFFIGAEVSGLFIHTLRKNTLFIVPIGVKIGTQLILWRFEFPVTFSLGMAWHSYLNILYFGMYLKAGLSVYFRATSNWSFGIASDWAWFPQWTKNDKASRPDNTRNINGNFVHLMLSARYHF